MKSIVAVSRTTQVKAFEPEIIFPSDSYEAAFVFFGVMAYPELGTGGEGGAGSHYATALSQFCFWATSKAKGLSYIRSERKNPRFVAPQKRQFQGIIDRGRRRIDRRIAAFELFATQLVRGFFRSCAIGQQALREGRTEEAFHMHPNGGPSPLRLEIMKRGLPSVGQVLASDLEGWSDRFGLNLTGPAADPIQKVKDLKSRAFEPSIPVLHMVHAYNECARKVGPTIGGWEERDHMYAMLLNAELWIWDALEIAERWRNFWHFPNEMSFSPDMMIELTRDDGNTGGIRAKAI